MLLEYSFAMGSSAKDRFGKILHLRPLHLRTFQGRYLLENVNLRKNLLSRNIHVLKDLISALLHLDPADISSVVITNPIELGKTIDEKYFILDIKLVMNGYTVINLEMQVIQIGLLNFTLFPEHPEFYATYQFLNVKKYTLYSNKLHLSVLDLTRTDLADKEDKKYQLDYWASLFRSATWEEIKMLAQNNDFIRQASETVYQLTREEAIRQQCEAREDYYRRENGKKAEMEAKDNAIRKLTETIEEQVGIIARLSEEIAALKNTLASFQEELSSLKQEIGGNSRY